MGSVSADSFSNCYTLFNKHNMNPGQNKAGLDKSEMANLAIHYSESGQQGQAMVLNTILAGGKDNQGYFDLVDKDKSGTVTQEELQAFAGISGSKDFEPSDFQTIGKDRFVAGGSDPTKVEAKVRQLASDQGNLTHLTRAEMMKAPIGNSNVTGNQLQQDVNTLKKPENQRTFDSAKMLGSLMNFAKMLGGKNSEKLLQTLQPLLELLLPMLNDTLQNTNYDRSYQQQQRGTSPQQ
jgi:hypothetical protein